MQFKAAQPAVPFKGQRLQLEDSPWSSTSEAESQTYAVLKSYARQAPYYDRIWRHYNNATLRATMETVPWGDVQWALDVGCGTGLLEEETQGFPAVGDTAPSPDRSTCSAVSRPF